MTIIKYKCKGRDGTESIVKTLAEAQAFVSKNGGTFELINETFISSCEAFTRRGYRNPGSRT